MGTDAVKITVVGAILIVAAVMAGVFLLLALKESNQRAERSAE